MRHWLLVFAIFAAFAAQPAWAGIGRIKRVVGAASVERAGKRVAIQPGFVLERGDTLITGKGGRIGVTFNDNSRFAAGPNSRVSITEFEFDDTTHQGRFLTQVDRGTLAIVSGQIAQSAKDAMRVRTPKALFGVRGRRFVVEVR